MKQPMVSIYVPTYNHENYITRALDSILMQRTEYSYEVFVGEDCSTDGTRAVLQAWEAAHPGVFTILYRQRNMHGSSCSNAADLKRRCTGKYLICLEGDDFWTDPEKLQRQVSFLESHPAYYAVAHHCTVVGRDGLPNGEVYPQCPEEEYTFRHFASDILPGQYTTLLARNYMTDPTVDKTLLSIQGGAGDRRIYFSLLCYGKIHCMQRDMSAYRHITDSGSSFSATNRFDYGAQLREQQAYLDYALAVGDPEAIRCAQFLYLRTVRYGLRKGHTTAKAAFSAALQLPKPLQAAWLLLKRDINCRILHKHLHI